MSSRTLYQNPEKNYFQIIFIQESWASNDNNKTYQSHKLLSHI